MKEDNTELVIKRIGGGSIIDASPVFSLDSEILYVVSGSLVIAYSVRTGEQVAEYEGLNKRAVAVRLHPTNPNFIVSCNTEGKLIHWDWRSKFIGKVVYLSYDRSLGSTITDFHLLPLNSEDDVNKYMVCVVWKHRKEDIRRVSICCGQQGQLLQKLKFHLDDSINSRHCLAVGGRPGDQYLAGIRNNCLQFCDTNDWQKCDLQRVGGSRVFTCVACHPEERCIATGDNSGRVLLWWNILSSGKPTYSIYHWHTLPCNTVAFSHAGSNFYSGGGECVLVKWNADLPSDKGFLPRLPADICHLSVAPENKYLAVATIDNGIRIVTSQMKFCSTVQHFTLSVAPSQDLPMFPAGMVFDPRSKTIVLNGRTGHIQIFSPRTKSLLYNLDITDMNYLTQERNSLIVNADVIRIAVNSDGHWLATVEYRDDRESAIEQRLKFWKFDDEKQIFCLNTSVEHPHNGRIVAIAFQPSLDPLQQLAVTTGTDFKFRTWTLTESTSIYNKKALVWACESMGFYRSLPAGDLSFSMDGSLLAIAFSSTLTVWEPETNELKCSLTPPRSEEFIIHVEFGRTDCYHLVVTSTESSIIVWNLLTLKLFWRVPLHVSILVADPCSEYMAAYTLNNTLFIFTPKRSTPTYVHKSVTSPWERILCAAFVPHSGTEKAHGIPWQENSQLYCLDSYQELFVLEKHVEDTTEKDGLSLPIASLQSLTPFGSLLARQNITDVEQVQIDTKQQLGVPGATAIKELLGTPAHTMPPVNLLCGPFLRSLVTSDVKTAKEDKNKIDDSKTEAMDIEDSEGDSGEETEFVKKAVLSPPVKQATKDVPSTASIEDLESRLKSILKEKMDWVNLLIK